MLYFTHMPRSP